MSMCETIPIAVHLDGDYDYCQFWTNRPHAEQINPSWHINIYPIKQSYIIRNSSLHDLCLSIKGNYHPDYLTKTNYTPGGPYNSVKMRSCAILLYICCETQLHMMLHHDSWILYHKLDLNNTSSIQLQSGLKDRVPAYYIQCSPKVSWRPERANIFIIK